MCPSTCEDQENDTEYPTIAEYFSGKKVFVTGATGFIGKALIEKLLRSCPNIGIIYVLMRPKKGIRLADRLQKLIKDALYDRLKNEQPSLILEKKIIPLSGDMCQINLGLSTKDRKLVTENVHVIFHAAASVRFDEPLQDAVILNVRGTREVCQLALDSKHLEAFIHVSTAFANCDRKEAHEILYSSKGNWKQTIEIAENFDKFTLDTLTPKILGDMPNTYCFTKNIAEHVVNDLCFGKVPVKIVRPSIVVGTLKEEPVSGWVDNFNGPLGLVVAYGKGIMRTSYANSQYKPDYIPVDVLTKALIVSAWDLALQWKKRIILSPVLLPSNLSNLSMCSDPQNNFTSKEFARESTIGIVQCTSHSVEWLRPSIRKLAESSIPIIYEIPFNNIVWLPTGHTTNNVAVWYINTIFFMLLPAFLLDSLLKISGKKPRLMKIQRKIYIAQLALRHFMTHEWIYPNDNLLALQKRIKKKDKDDWDYDFMNGNLETYVRNCCMGLRRYLLAEPDHTLPAAKLHFTRIYWIHQILKFGFWIVIVMLFYKFALFNKLLSVITQ